MAGHQVAGWLLRSGSLALPAATRGFSLSFSSSNALRSAAGACASNCTCLASHALANTALPSSSGLMHRSYSATTPAATATTAVATTAVAVPAAGSATATAAGTTAPAASSGLSLPRWLRNLFPGGKDLAADAPSASRESSGADASSSSSEGTPAAEDMKQLDELRSMDMQGYVDYCKKMRGGAPPPRPRKPPVARDHYDFPMFQDFRRISFLRLQQHERIGSQITKQESDLILDKREDVLRDRALLQTIADRTGVFIDLEVKDCIQQFLDTRQRAQRFHRYAVEFGKGLPKDNEQQKAATRFMERKEAEEELLASLGRRDVAACPLRHKLAWAGPSALCDMTGLRYYECCGATTTMGLEGQASGPIKVPAHLLHAKKQGKRVVVDIARDRDAYTKYKGRLDGRLRKAFLTSNKPRFRDY